MVRDSVVPFVLVRDPQPRAPSKVEDGFEMNEKWKKIVPGARMQK